MDVLLRRLLRAATRRGLGGDWTWLVIAICAWLLRRSMNDRGGVVSSLRISPGEQVVLRVRNWDDPVFESENGGTRADKRRAKERAKESAKQEEKLRAKISKDEKKSLKKSEKKQEKQERRRGKVNGRGAGAKGAGVPSADAVDADV